jgi:hypothetical protein
MKNLVCFLCGIVMLFVASSCVDKRHAKNYNLLMDEGSVTFIQQGLEQAKQKLKRLNWLRATQTIRISSASLQK